MSIFNTRQDDSIQVSKIVEIGHIFGFEDSAIRVALRRLLTEGVLQSTQRSHYAISNLGKRRLDNMSHWSSLEQEIGNWAGEWVCLQVSHLGRTNQKAVRHREKAMSSKGFRPYVDGLWLRPDNLKTPLDEQFTQLINLGLDTEAIIIQSRSHLGIDANRAAELWDRHALESAYLACLNTLERSLKHLNNKDIIDQAKETLTIGNNVIKVLSTDPLLPKKLVDCTLRAESFSKMREYQRVGQAAWREVW